MAVVPSFLGPLARLVARAIIARGLEAGLEEATGNELPGFPDIVGDVADDLGVNLGSASEEEIAEVVEIAAEEAGVTEEQARRLINQSNQKMVDFNQYMSIALGRCGSDRETFRQLTQIWNEEKEIIQSMTPQEVRENISCP